METELEHVLLKDINTHRILLIRCTSKNIAFVFEYLSSIAVLKDVQYTTSLSDTYS